jgi:hemerythrin-like domain-containing protein
LKAENSQVHSTISAISGRQAASQSRRPREAPPAVALLNRDHANFARVLDALDDLADLVAAGRPVNLDIARAAAVYYKGYVAEFHHPIEDLIYGLLRIQVPAAAARLFAVVEDHQHYAKSVTSLLAAIRSFQRKELGSRGVARPLLIRDHDLLRENFCLAMREFASHMRGHMSIEKPLFDLAIERLSEDDWATIDRSVAAKTDPLFCGSNPARFKHLLKAVAAADARMIAEKQRARRRRR